MLENLAYINILKCPVLYLLTQVRFGKRKYRKKSLQNDNNGFTLCIQDISKFKYTVFLIRVYIHYYKR